MLSQVRRAGKYGKDGAGGAGEGCCLDKEHHSTMVMESQIGDRVMDVPVTNTYQCVTCHNKNTIA